MSECMIKIVLIDDTNDAVETFKESLRRWNPNENFDIIKCTNFSNALNEIKKVNPDVVFLKSRKIAQKELNFIDSLPKKEFHLIVSLVVGYGDWNPVRLTDLPLTGRTENTNLTYQSVDKINISADGKVYFLNRSDVIYLKSDKSYTTIFLSRKRKIVASKTLKEIQKKFIFPEFYRVHNSYVINLNHIVEYNRGLSELTLSDGTVVSVSRRKKKQLLEILQLERKS